jgi:hypothetical protein
MNVIRTVGNLALRIATVAAIAGATFLILLGLNRMGVPLRTNPVIEVVLVACWVTWRLYRGSTPVEEIRRFLYLDGPIPGGDLRSNNRLRGP